MITAPTYLYRVRQHGKRHLDDDTVLVVADTGTEAEALAREVLGLPDSAKITIKLAIREETIYRRRHLNKHLLPEHRPGTASKKV